MPDRCNLLMTSPERKIKDRNWYEGEKTQAFHTLGVCRISSVMNIFSCSTCGDGRVEYTRLKTIDGRRKHRLFR